MCSASRIEPPERFNVNGTFFADCCYTLSYISVTHTGNNCVYCPSGVWETIGTKTAAVVTIATQAQSTLKLLLCKCRINRIATPPPGVLVEVP